MKGTSHLRDRRPTLYMNVGMLSSVEPLRAILDYGCCGLMAFWSAND